MESAYLKKCFGNSLTLALAEVAKMRPSDPIEYLAHWLYHYQKVTKVKEKDRQEKIQLKEEYDCRLKEAEMTKMLKQEEHQIQVKCEKYHQDLFSTAVSHKKNLVVQEDTEPLEKEAPKQEPLPGTSSMIPETLPENIFSELAGQTDLNKETPQERNNQEASPQKEVQEMPSGSSSP